MGSSLFTPGINQIGVPGPQGPAGPAGDPGGGGGPHTHPEYEHTHPYSGTAHTHPEYVHDHPYASDTHNHSGVYATVAHNHDGSYAPTHTHPFASDTHNHDANYSGVGHTHDTTHNHDATYAPVHGHPYADVSHGTHVDFGEVGDIVGSAFGDTAAAGATGEVADAGHRHAREANPVTAHEANAGDIHPQYLKESDANWVDLTDGGATTLHSHTGGSHPDLATHDSLGLATDAELASHAAAADPHTGYRLESADHSHASTGLQAGQLVQANTHGTPDTDSAPGSLHHTIGAGANQAAAGNHGHSDPSVNFATASQAITANTVTYITGSGILIPAAGLVAGQMYRWYIGVSKTAAGTATPIWTPRIGANQTTADGTVLTITGTAQVATLSGTLIIVTAVVRVASATGTIVGSVNTGAASFGIGGNVASGSYDTTGKAGQRFGLCVNTGASAAWTIQSVRGELVG